MEASQLPENSTPSTAPPPKVSASPAADVDPAPPGGTIELALLGEGQVDTCPLWVTLTRAGSRASHELLPLGDVSRCLRTASQDGVALTDSTLLIDTQIDGGPRYAYLVAPPESGFRAAAEWVRRVVDAIRGLAPRSIGLHFSPELVGLDASQELLSHVVRGVCTAPCAIEHIGLLCSPAEINTVLGTALRLKSDLMAEGMAVVVFH